MQRKATATTRGPNAEEKQYQAWVKESNHCAACNNVAPVIGHHCWGATFKHMKTLIGHWFFIGLCQTCDDVITHGSRRGFINQFGPQSDLWCESIIRYEVETGRTAPEDVRKAIIDWGQ